MRILFVFVFLLGLVSCDNRKNAPKCDEIEGISYDKGENHKLSLPFECDDENYPEFIEHKNYTGIIKICENEFITQYGNYVNGKLNGKTFQFSSPKNPISSFNVFDFFKKSKLISEYTYIKGECIKTVWYNTNGQKVLEESGLHRKGWYDNGQLAFDYYINPEEENTSKKSHPNKEGYWNEKGEKITENEYNNLYNHSINYESVFEFIGIAITPFTLFLIFIFYRRKKKQKKAS